MEQQNQSSSSCFPNKRKRGRPRRDESQTHQQVKASIDENLIGQVVSGVVEGSFEAGYFLNVKVADTEKQLKGVVFLPEKVTPVTPTTDLFPQAKMYAREDSSIPPQGNKAAGNQTNDLIAATCTTLLPDDQPLSNAGIGYQRNLPTDTQIKDVGGSSAKPEGQTLSLMPQFGHEDVHKEDYTSLRSEAVTTSTAEGTTTLVDFFPTPGTTMRSGTEEEKKSPADAEPRRVDLKIKEKPASPVDDVPEELQLELGSKNLSASAIASEANPDQPASSKSGFLANLFEGREEPFAASETGFPDATQVDDKDS